MYAIRISACVLILAFTAATFTSANSDAAGKNAPLVVAHRGLLHHAPENTLANFRACLELRIGFEFDVQRTRDGHLVCIHDTTVDRTTNGNGNVAAMTLAEVRQLDAGSWFDPSFADERVPTVDEVLKLVAGHRDQNVLIAVDLKTADVGPDVAKLAQKYRILDRLLFIGKTITEPTVRQQIRLGAAQAHTAAVANDASELKNAIAVGNADWVYVRYLPTQRELQSIRDAGKRTFIAGSTVSGNVPANWQHATTVGIDAVLTDYSLELRQKLRNLAASP